MFLYRKNDLKEVDMINLLDVSLFRLMLNQVGGKSLSMFCAGGVWIEFSFKTHLEAELLMEGVLGYKQGRFPDKQLMSDDEIIEHERARLKAMEESEAEEQKQ